MTECTQESRNKKQDAKSPHKYNRSFSVAVTKDNLTPSKL